MNLQETVDGLSYPERLLLLTLAGAEGSMTPEQALAKGDFQAFIEVMNAASWLASKGFVDMEEHARKMVSLKDADAVTGGLPERIALMLIADRGGEIPMSSLGEALDEEDVPIAIGWLRRKKLADITKRDGVKMLSLNDAGRAAVDVPMADEELLLLLAGGELPEDDVDGSIIKDLRSRKTLIADRLEVTRSLTLTELGREALSLGIELKEEVAQLTPELIQTGRWKDVSFRRYDVNTFAPDAFGAKKHPLTRIADEIRRIFLQMGFSEIDGEYVQPAFWNMDVLFTPQDHPARDQQDTFYLEHPDRIVVDDEELVAKVRAIHENGGDTGSKGWGYKWSREESEKALLRTHTTVNTISYLAKNPDPPAKVFSISRIFRKEAIDATHLPEFTQIEGIIMAEGANFDMLVSVLRQFYARMGFDRIRIRPGYFPYTEPSLEVEVFFNGKWMELGGAGIFRPEVTAPFGVKCPVLAWGLGFERLAMLRWDIKDIRDLYISDVDLLRQSTLI